MNDTPTPRTDTTWDRMCCSGQPWYQIAEEMKFDCRQLETELAAVTEQRDGLRSAVDYASDQLTRVTEQRDRLAEALEQIASSDPNWRDCLLIARKALQSLNQPTP